jgi:hypothetical protein
MAHITATNAETLIPGYVVSALPCGCALAEPITGVLPIFQGPAMVVAESVAAEQGWGEYDKRDTFMAIKIEGGWY